MADDPKVPGGPRLNPFEKADRTTREAASIAGADLDAARTKTARLKAERLAKAAAEGTSELDKKLGAARSKPKRRSRHLEAGD